MKSSKKIVVIGGGTGVFVMLSGLKNYFKDLTAIVTMADDGGSAGMLREDFGILPPGDIRRALVALAGTDNKLLSDLFNYRFEEGRGLTGHSFGNLFITALERITNDFQKAIEETGKILGIEGKVYPVTLQKTYLMAELENGDLINGESRIGMQLNDRCLKIRKVWLNPKVSINPNAKRAILNADGIVIGPGDLYTSLIPNLLVSGMKNALAKTKAKIMYFINLMTRFGETSNFAASDFFKTIDNYLPSNTIDYVIINKTRPSAMRFRPYAKERADFVGPDIENFGKKPVPVLADLLRPAGLVRHDPDKAAKLVKMLV